MEHESERTTADDWDFGGASDSVEFFQFCDICHFRKTQTVILSGHEKVLFGKLLSIVCPTTPYHYHARTSCISCLEKLHHLKEYLREILLNALRIHKIHVRTTNSMQDEEERQAPTTTKKPDKHQDKEEKHSESYTCQCSDCRMKFGGLALLVDVIERREKKTCEEELEEREKTYTKTEVIGGIKKEEEEAQPSTSRESPCFSRSSLETPSEEPSSSSQTPVLIAAPKKPTTSTKIRQMRCLHCSKTFTHKGDLNKHLRKHTGEQPFTCPVCQRRFAHTSNLSRHVRLHSGHRPYACDVCNKRFSRKDKLDLHKRSKYCRKSSK